MTQESMKRAPQTHLLIGSIYALGCESLYGLSYLFTKHALAIASDFALLGWRFLIAVLVMRLCIVLGWIKIDLKHKPLKPLLRIACFSPGLYFIGETIGIRNTTTAETGVFLACIPIASLVAATILLKEKPFKTQVIGIVMTLVGVLVTVFTVGATSSFSVLGYSGLLLAILAYAFYSVSVETASDYTGAEITYVMIVTGAVLFALLAVIEAVLKGQLAELIYLPFQVPAFRDSVLYQGIGCSVIAFFLSNLAISKIGVNRTASFIGISTVISIIAGAVWLKEPFRLMQFIGAAIIILGVYVANMPHGKH